MSYGSCIEWKDVSLLHSKSKKTILQNLQGKVMYGEFLTIMGRSGAGKSSFLSILTGRLTAKTKGFRLEGKMLLNGEMYDSSQFSKCAAYVRQDDIILGTLTVEETFEFQAKLKLHQLSYLEQQFKINQVIKKLNLQQCRKTLIGSQFSKSISGGQRKRVAIGVELLADPSCLVLDEPTSGLDSYNSLKIMRILRKLAEDGRAIIATIHQPSSLMFQQMDKLILLNKGQTLYMGPAKQIVPYMVSIGIEINHHMNPADFFMLEVSEFKSSQGKYKTPMTADKFKQYQQYVKSQVSQPQSSQIISIISNMPSFKPPMNREASILKQFPILFKRSLKNYFRTISNLYGKILVIIVIPLLMIGLYNNIGNQFPQQTDIEQITKFLAKIGAFLFMLTFFNFGMNVYDTVLSYPSEKELILKQTSSRLYSLSSYYICRCMIQVPIAIISCLLYVTIVYFLTGLDTQFQYFIRFILVNVLIAICGYMFGSMVGILFSTAEYAIQILPIYIIPLLIFGGLVVNLKTIPAYSSWIQYISPIRHSYSAIILSQMSSQKLHNIIQYDYIKDLLGVGGSYWENVLYLSAISAFCAISSLALLYIKRKPI